MFLYIFFRNILLFITLLQSYNSLAYNSLAYNSLAGGFYLSAGFAGSIVSDYNKNIIQAPQNNIPINALNLAIGYSATKNFGLELELYSTFDSIKFNNLQTKVTLDRNILKNSDFIERHKTIYKIIYRIKMISSL